jgi:hypothetical protein
MFTDAVQPRPPSAAFSIGQQVRIRWLEKFPGAFRQRVRGRMAIIADYMPPDETGMQVYLVTFPPPSRRAKRIREPLAERDLEVLPT